MIKYLLRIESEELWQKARIKALKEKTTMKEVIISLIQRWVKGEVEI